MDDTSSSPLVTTEDVLWTHYVDAIRKRGKLVGRAIGLSWGVLLLAALLWPTTFVCKSVLAISGFDEARDSGFDQAKDSRQPKPEEQEPRAGISLGSFKLLMAALGDRTLLERTFAEGDLGALVAAEKISTHVLPIGETSRDDIARMDKNDRILGIRLYYEDRSAERATKVVERLAALVREALITQMGSREMEAQLMVLTRRAAEQQTRLQTLVFTNESLGKLEADKKALARIQPLPMAAREVVDVSEGGQLYLPPLVQIVGVRARIDQNAHEIRILERFLKIDRLKIGFLERMRARIGSGIGTTRSYVVDDLPTLIQQELDDFSKANPGPNSVDARLSLQSLHDRLSAQRASVIFTQHPGVSTKSRTMLFLAAGALAALFFLAAALVAESWEDQHGRVGAGVAPVSKE